MGRVGIHDRAIKCDKRTTFVAINLGYNYTAEHEGDIRKWVKDFKLSQAWAKERNRKLSEADVYRLTNKWRGTEYFKQGFIVPYYTPCLMGEITIEEDPNNYFNLLKGGEYVALGIGVPMDKANWETFIQRVKCEADILDVRTYNRIDSVYTADDCERLRKVPFDAMWGDGSHGIYLYMQATYEGERIMRSIKRCVEQGNLLIAPKSQIAFPQAKGGLVLVNMKKLDKLMVE